MVIPVERRNGSGESSSSNRSDSSGGISSRTLMNCWESLAVEKRHIVRGDRVEWGGRG